MFCVIVNVCRMSVYKGQNLCLYSIMAVVLFITIFDKRCSIVDYRVKMYNVLSQVSDRHDNNSSVHVCGYCHTVQEKYCKQLLVNVVSLVV